MGNLKNLVSTIVLLLALSSCGGGGGSGGGAPNFAGVYDVTGRLISNSCGLNLPLLESLFVRQTVNQDGERIVVNSGTAVAVGMVNEKRDGFMAFRESRNGNCRTVTGVGYFISETAGIDFNVATIITSTCGTQTCELLYDGAARKVR